MKKQKILFILDDDILTIHHGVRRYILSLAFSINEYFDCKFAICRKNHDRSHFYNISFTDEYIINNGFFENNLVAKDKKNIIEKIIKDDLINKKEKSNRYPSYFTTFIGQKITEKFDYIIVAAPWIHIDKNGFDCPISCIGLDAIPNIYALNNINDIALREFAYKHKKGFEYYNSILAISDDSKNQIESFTRTKNNILVIPPFFPAGFSNIKSQPKFNGKSTIVLAAPFDERKGLYYLPELINKSNIDSIKIFGGVRCSKESLLGFFKKLDIDNIEWWYSVNTHQQIKLYQESHLLLFPSLNEGLGLPVIEAHACNIPAVVNNIKPLNQLVENEYIIDLNNSATDNAEIIKKISNSNYSHDFKSRWENNVSSLMNNLINGHNNE